VPDARLLLLCGAVLAALLLVFALLRSRRRGGPMLTQARPLPPMKGSLDATAARRGVSLELGQEIYGLLEAGRHAEAVARVREVSGWDAEEAERMVAKLETWKRRLES
jgi:hypothetical protein